MEKVFLRLLRVLYANKGRIKPRDPATEYVHVTDDFIFATDGGVMTVAPNIIPLSSGAWDGKTTLSEFSGENVGSPALPLLKLIPKVKQFGWARMYHWK